MMRRYLGLRWYVRSDDGQDYAVGVWVNGTYVPGSRADAVREAAILRALGESNAYAWGRTRRSTHVHA